MTCELAIAVHVNENRRSRQQHIAYLMYNKHSNEDDVIVEGEFPVFSDPGCPPDHSSKE